MPNPKQSEELSQYLLGRLAEPDRERIEERFFSDTALFDELTAAEDELVDGYLLGRLTPSDHRQFEQYYLASPERAGKVAAARQLRAWIDSQQRNNSPPVAESWWQRLAHSLAVPQWSMGAAAAALLVAAGAWYLATRPATETRPRQTAAVERPAVTPPPTPQQERQQQPTPPPPPPKRTMPAFAFTLLPGTLRGASGGVQTVRLPKDATTARMALRLEQPAELAVFRVALETVEGRTVWQGEAQGSGMIVNASLPLDGLAGGDYLVRLTGAATRGGTMESVADYSVRFMRDLR